MKKILFMGGLTSGGAEHQMVVLARVMKNSGYEVSFLGAGEDSFYEKDLLEAGIPLYRIKVKERIEKFHLNPFYITYHVYKVLKKGNFDTVVSFLGLWNFENCFLAKKSGVAHRAITGLRNSRDEVLLSRSDKIFTFFEKYAYKKVSNSESAKRKFANYFPKVADKLMTIYNIVDLPTITSSYKACHGGRIHVIVPASYRSVKNPMRLLQAIALLKDKEKSLLHLDWYGNIGGGLKCYEEMKTFIKENQLSEIVTLHDATNDIANRINESDIVGLFSTSEGLPNAICEGMMLGKPIVMTRVSDFDVLAGQGNGFLCDADNTESITKALSLVCNLTKDEIRVMGEKSRKIASSLFSSESIVEKWKEII